MIRLIIACVLSLSMTACTINKKPPALMKAPHKQTFAETSELQQGKRYFDDGYYKHAMHTLLPLACDGIAEAQYAVGYMYYYGLGVAQDTDVGYFWIQRSANQGFLPAIKAITLMHAGKDSGGKIEKNRKLTMTQ